MTGSKFQLHYFDAQGLCIPIRALLTIAGADWEHKFQTWETWAAVKPTTPLGTLPVLIETTESNETFEVPEASAIERYLASKFDMEGSNVVEKVQVNVAVSLFQGLGSFWQHKVLMSSVEEMPKYLEEFKTKEVPQWMTACEKLLIKNGSRGYFAGDKITYADICASAMMDYLLAVEGMDKVLNEKAAPNLFACKRKVDSNPRYQAYRRSDVFRRLSAGAEGYIQTRFGFDMSKSHIV